MDGVDDGPPVGPDGLAGARALDADAVETSEIEVRFVQGRAVEDGVLEVRAPEARAAQVGIPEGAAREVRLGELGPGQVHPVKVEATEVQAADVGRGEAGAPPDGFLDLLAGEHAGAGAGLVGGVVLGEAVVHHAEWTSSGAGVGPGR